MNTSELFYSRMKSAWTYAMRIIRVIIGGGGTPLILGIVLIALYFAYQQFLAWVPADFPIDFMLTIPYTLLVTSSRVRTWVKPADLVFLLPVETQMKPYFRASLTYSAAVHLIHLGILTLLAYPLFFIMWKSNLAIVLAYLFFTLLQVYNVLIEWWEMRLTVSLARNKIRMVTAGRFFLNGGTVFFFLNQHAAGVLGTAVGLFALGWYLRRQVPVIPYPWHLMQAQEQNIRTRYHALAGMFVDLPRLKTPVRKRKWFTRFLPHWSTQTASAYLFWRAFFRKSELFPISIRLIIWAMIFIAVFPNRWVVFAVYLGCVWMFSVQLPSLAHSQQYPIIHKLYPLPPKQWKQGLRSIGLVTIGIQTLSIALFAWLAGAMLLTETMLLIAVGGILTYTISYFYLPRSKQQKMA
ncbi:ABC transporter permease [Thermoactinomyces mirandus]|uniref:ABC transporter permease n=1 Tax=Thermoactinomyces mirandus TaxID=2756294 RepID=A0A7W1XTD3_9BACL|nr:ABC transporter permease [Thermoactinomyces mirandus]MBA4602710.1 ABC transporter permease [Thermoactinomyces mirandus]